MRKVTGGLWESTPDNPSPGLTTHAYLWTPASAGNTLFYSVATDRDFDHFEQLGGISHQYLSHRDEAGPMLAALQSRFGAQLHAPGAERAEIARHREPDVVFVDPRTDANGVTVVPTPGHSPGSTCFLVDGAAGRYLFTGDTLFPAADGTWTAGYLPGISDPDSLLLSLGRLAQLEPDLVASSAYQGSSGVHRVRPATWRAEVERARAALERNLAGQ